MNQETKIVKRFVAGAVCPSCSQMDKLVAYTQGEIQVRECVRCGYKDSLNAEGHVLASEVVTRVNQPRADEPALAHEEPVQVLKLD